MFRSNLHIYAQLIDDLNGVTVAAATSAGKSAGLKHGGNSPAAKAVGKKLAEAAKAKGITKAAFDRGAYRFHGRIAALAVAATESRAGLHEPRVVKAKRRSAAKHAPKAKARSRHKQGRRQAQGRRAKGEAKKGKRSRKATRNNRSAVTRDHGPGVSIPHTRWTRERRDRGDGDSRDNALVDFVVKIRRSACVVKGGGVR